MKKYTYLIIFLSFSIHGFSDELYPKSVNEFVEQVELCQHFSGEISGDPAIDQARNLKADLDKYCIGLDRKRDKLRDKYRHLPQIINKLNSYGKCLNDCKQDIKAKVNEIPIICDKYNEGEFGYPPYGILVIDNYSIIIFKTEDKINTYHKKLELLKLNCQTGSINNLGFFTSQDYQYGNVDVSFMHNENLFIIHSDSAPSSVAERYSSKIYTVLVYFKSNSEWMLDKKLTHYFGEGGDVIDYSASNESQKSNLMNIFPYKTKQDIIEGLSNKLFDVYKKLANKESISATIIRKTKLQEVTNYFADEKRYLIKADKVNIVDVSSGWLLVEYKNPKKGIIKGWVMCADTNICN